jgi:hypothetical protein
MSSAGVFKPLLRVKAEKLSLYAVCHSCEIRCFTLFAALNTALDQCLRGRVMPHARGAPPVMVMTCFHDWHGITLGWGRHKSFSKKNAPNQSGR